MTLSWVAKGAQYVFGYLIVQAPNVKLFNATAVEDLGELS